jgi:SAM-dependent methyltransferase
MPQAYDRWLAPSVFRPFAVDLARRAANSAPRRLLEIAAGTGVLTRELVTAIPAARVTATDLNAAMVEFGSRRVPLAAWRQADALRLPFDDRQFDLVICQFGVMFFPDRPAAFGEMRRVLAPGGRLLFSTWGDRRDARLRRRPGGRARARLPRRPAHIHSRRAARLLRPWPGRRRPRRRRPELRVSRAGHARRACGLGR